MSYFQVGARVRLSKDNPPGLAAERAVKNEQLIGRISAVHPRVAEKTVWTVTWNHEVNWPSDPVFPCTCAHYEHFLMPLPDDDSLEGRVLTYLERELKNG